MTRKKEGYRVTVAKGVKVRPGVEEKMRKKKGSSSAGRWKNVAPKDFAGKSGGASKYSFPIPDIRHARNALARAHFAPNPEGIRKAVYRKFPELKKRKLAREGKVRGLTEKGTPRKKKTIRHQEKGIKALKKVHRSRTR